MSFNYPYKEKKVIDDLKEEFKLPKTPKITNFQKDEAIAKSYIQDDPIKLLEMGPIID